MAMADIVHVPQRAKAELHDQRLLVITQMAQVTHEDQIAIEQVSLVLGSGRVASFQEQSDDVFDPVRERIRTSAARIRSLGADHLLYALGETEIPYLRDAHEHAFQTLDAIETCRERVVGLMDLQLSSASHRLNEVMKTLTIVATIFSPLTFLTGV